MATISGASLHAAPLQMTLVRAAVLLLLAAPVPCLRLVGDAVALGRRGALTALGAAALGPAAAVAEARLEDTLQMRTSSSGLQWTDLKAGQGGEVQKGDRIWVEYMMTRRGGAKIYSTKQAQQPFSWVLGDGSVIDGLELMVSGSGDIPPLRPGGARRAIVPQVLGYGKDKGFFSSGAPTEIRNLQPVPPPYVWTDGNGDKVDAYLRFKNMYLNENRLDQPDLILDVILRAPPANAAELLESAPPPTVSTSPFGVVEP